MANSEITPANLTIGKLASIANVNIETVRYYQGLGLIATPSKPKRGYRKYSQQVVDQIMFIKRAQQLGFSLQEIAELLKIGSGRCRDIRKRAEQKRDKIGQQIQDLEVLKTTLERLISECRSGKNNHHCPLIESLLTSDSSL